MSDDVVESGTAGPPRSVRVAVALLALLALDDVVAVVLAAAASDTSGPEVVGGIVSTVIRLAILGTLARVLWRGSSSGRVLVIVVGVLNVVGTVAFGLVSAQGLELAWTIAELVLVVALVALMFTASARSWCQGGHLDRSADEARERRRQQRAHLAWGPRLAQALRDDRDARR